MFTRAFAILTIVFFTIPSSVLAQDSVYVNDVLYVPLRSGAGIEYRIINAAMKSSTKLTRLNISEDGQWSKVVTEGGTEGWIRNQYLTEEMTSELKLNRALTRLARIEKENAELESENKQLKSQNSQLNSRATNEFGARTKMANELEKIKQLSASAIDLDRRHQELLKKYELTQTQRDSLQAENEKLTTDRTLSYMLYGAGILILGMIIAVVLPALKPKKRYSEWT